MAQRTTRCRWCNWPTAIVLLIVLATIGTIGGCSSVQHGVRQSSLDALAGAGLDGVDVANVNYRDVTLRGPGSDEATALAVVEALPIAHEVTYEETGGAAVSTTTTTAPTTTTTSVTGVVTPTISIDGTVKSGTLTLSGTVPDEATHKLLLDQAITAYLADNVVDQITVQGVATTGDLSVAAVDLARLFPAFKNNLQTGQFQLRDTSLSISGHPASLDGYRALTTSIANLSRITDVAVSFDTSERLVELQDTIAQLVAQQKITFEPGSATLTGDSTHVLDQIAGAIQTAIAGVPDVQIEIGGYTDSQGVDQLNLELSQKRADAVLAYLVGKGLPAAVFTAVGYGESDPIATNDTEEGRAENRRVEFKIMEG